MSGHLPHNGKVMSKLYHISTHSKSLRQDVLIHSVSTQIYNLRPIRDFGSSVRKDTENGPSEKIIRTKPSVVFEGCDELVNLDAKITGRSSCPADAKLTECSSHSGTANWGYRQARPYMLRGTGNSPQDANTTGYSSYPASALLTVFAEVASVRLCNVIKNIPYRDDSTVSRFLCSSIWRFAA